MHGRATQGSCIAQDGAFDGRAVGGAPGAIFLFTMPLRTSYDCDKIPGRVLGRDQITCAELFCGCVHRHAASGSCFERDDALDGRAVRDAPGVANAV